MFHPFRLFATLQTDGCASGPDAGALGKRACAPFLLPSKKGEQERGEPAPVFGKDCCCWASGPRGKGRRGSEGEGEDAGAWSRSGCRCHCAWRSGCELKQRIRPATHITRGRAAVVACSGLVVRQVRATAARPLHAWQRLPFNFEGLPFHGGHFSARNVDELFFLVCVPFAAIIASVTFLSRITSTHLAPLILFVLCFNQPDHFFPLQAAVAISNCWLSLFPSWADWKWCRRPAAETPMGNGRCVEHVARACRRRLKLQSPPTVRHRAAGPGEVGIVSSRRTTTGRRRAPPPLEPLGRIRDTKPR